MGRSPQLVNNKSKVIRSGRGVAPPEQQVQHGSVSNQSKGDGRYSNEGSGENHSAKRAQAAGELLVGGSNKQTLAKCDESGGPAA